MAKTSLAVELWSYLGTRKKWWLVPVLLVTIALGILVTLSQSSVLGPAIYAIF